MRSTLDSIFEVGFGVELNCLDGSSKEGNEFLRAFDESNALIYWRYVDPFWKLKRFFDIGSEAPLKKNVKVIDQFVNNLIRKKRKLLAERHDTVSSRVNIFCICCDSRSSYVCLCIKHLFLHFFPLILIFVSFYYL